MATSGDHMFSSALKCDFSNIGLISNGDIINTLLFFVEKMCKYIAKDSHIFSTKNNSVFAFEVDIWLTN